MPVELLQLKLLVGIRMLEHVAKALQQARRGESMEQLLASCCCCCKDCSEMDAALQVAAARHIASATRPTVILILKKGCDAKLQSLARGSRWREEALVLVLCLLIGYPGSITLRVGAKGLAACKGVSSGSADCDGGSDLCSRCFGAGQPHAGRCEMETLSLQVGSSLNSFCTTSSAPLARL